MILLFLEDPAETDIAKDIENELIENNITNYQNLAGKTTIPELIEKIAGLSLFITNDSGPMHVAAAYKVKTAAIFWTYQDLKKQINGIIQMKI